MRIPVGFVFKSKIANQKIIQNLFAFHIIHIYTTVICPPRLLAMRIPVGFLREVVNKDGKI